MLLQNSKLAERAVLGRLGCGVVGGKGDPLKQKGRRQTRYEADYNHSLTSRKYG